MKTNWPALRCGFMILTGVALGVNPSFAKAQEPAGASATSAVISSVAITQAPQHTAVRVAGEGRLEVHAMQMQNPDRLVLDFSGARLAVDKSVIPGASEPVRDVRLGQFRPNVARVVVDLAKDSPYHISHDGMAVVVLFDAPAQSVVPVSSELVTSTEEEKPRGAIEYSAAAPRASVHRTLSSQVSAPRFSLPSELTQPSVVLASFNGSHEPAVPQTNQDA